MKNQKSRVTTCVIVSDLEVFTSCFNRHMPSDSFHDGFSSVVFSTCVSEICGVLLEELKDMWVLLVILPEVLDDVGRQVSEQFVAADFCE